MSLQRDQRPTDPRGRRARRCIARRSAGAFAGGQLLRLVQGHRLRRHQESRDFRRLPRYRRLTRGLIRILITAAQDKPIARDFHRTFRSATLSRVR